MPVAEPVRVTVPRGTLGVLGDGVRVGDGADWDWFRTDVRPVPAADEERVVTVADDGAVRTLLAAASPRHSAVPGDDEIRRWVGVQADDGTLLACAAHTEAVPGVPHLASIATHPSARGQGLGALVTGALTRRLLDEGFPAGTLGMYADNDVARRMYLRLGYRCDHEWSSRAIVLH
ncbi:MAG: GNAT family N-acetyltransferase [Rhodoferax sp.]|nr:GNAT family N-acetyltransferase [Actinomycetota bacterium]